MDRWFTVEEIDVQTYAISEYQHWEQSHCYLLCGQQRAALIDTGLGVSDIQRVVSDLTKLPVTVLTTHAHWDHIGGHRYFNDIAVHEEEKDWLSVRFPLPLQEVKKQLTKEHCDFPGSFDLDRYRIFQGVHKEFCWMGIALTLAVARFRSFTRRGTRPVTAAFTRGKEKPCIPVTWFTRDACMLFTRPLIPGFSIVP